MSIGSFGTNLTPIASGLSAAAGAARMGATTDLTITGGSGVTPSYFGDFTQGTLPTGMTFTRASNASYFNSAGVLTQATTNQLRFDYNPNTLAFNGALIEEARTNFALNSTAPGTGQTISLAAGTYICWIIGTGSMVVSLGTAVGTGTGTATNTALDWYTSNSFVTLVITTAGTIILANTGSVTFVQVEGNGLTHTGPTSPIVTAGSSATRAIDVLSITKANVAGFNATAGGWQSEFIPSPTSINNPLNPRVIAYDNGVTPLYINSTTLSIFDNTTSTGAAGILAANTIEKGASTYQGIIPYESICLNAGAVATESASTMPAPTTTINFGSTGANSPFNGWLRKVRYFNSTLTAAQLQTVTGAGY